MKIAVVDTEIGSASIGGGQLILPGMLAGLRKSGHEVLLVADGVPNEKVRPWIEASGATVHMGYPEIGKIVDDRVVGFSAWISDLAPEVFVISTSADMGWVALPHLDSAIATVAIGHNDSWSYYEPARYYRDFLTRAVGVSDEICDKYSSVCRIDRERIDWIPYGVEAAESAPADNGKGPLKLIYVGRLDEHQKRVSDVVKLTKLLSQNGVDFVFDIVGDGDEMPLVKRELADETASGKVRMRGWLEATQVTAAMRSAEVFILASAYEGFCIALTEAMANGCCPVVTDIRSGNKQLIEDGKNGLIVPIGDIDAFVDKIKFLADNGGQLLEMRRAAWQTGREYGIDRMVDSYIDCFERAVVDARSNPRTPDPDFPLMESCRSKYPLWLRRIKAKAKGILATN